MASGSRCCAALLRARFLLGVINAAVSTLSGFVLLALWISSGTFLDDDGCAVHTSNAVLRVLITIPPALWMFSKSTSKHLRLVAEFMIVGLAFQAMWLTQNILECGFWELVAIHEWHMSLAAAQHVWYLFVTFELVLERLGALQRESMLNMHVKNTWVLLVGAAVVSQPNFFIIQFVPEFSGKKEYVGITSIVGFTLLFAAIFLICYSLLKALRLTKAASVERSLGPRVLRTLRIQVIGGIVGVTTSYALQAVSFWQMVVWQVPQDPESNAWNWTWFMTEMAAFIEAVANTFLGLALSGVTAGALQGTAKRDKADRNRRRRWHQADKAVGQGDTEWDKKVRELAHRGVTLDVLLSFYKSLGVEIMPGFDSSSSTTKDVVYNAIIPLSSKQGCALAELLMDGRPCRAEVMVTHNWSNLFRDMLAAVCADALGEADISKIALTLTSDVGVLESWVKRLDVGSRVYWICAFAVNQHLSICASPPAPYEPCSCGMPKVLNDAPPLTSDGKSVPCEMNKFDEMMKYLSAANRSFQQVVAVDLQFQLFNRAWCVAEIAAANQCGMRQNLKIWSSAVLEKNKARLGALKVQEMQASRKEDAEQILASIPDVEAFNENLRYLLLEDLLPAWHSLDGEEQMVLAGQMIRWHVVGPSLHQITDRMTE